MINRLDVFNIAKEELSGNNDLRKTTEVSFYGETARDYGGLRKEFFRLCLQEINEKHFAHGLREEMIDDFNIIGVIFVLSILQNVFDSIQTIHEADVENDYLSTNLNIENLNFESTWEVEILKKHSTVTFWMQRKISKLVSLYNSFG